MESEKINKIEESVKNLSSKKCKLYFLVQDTKGNAKGSVRFIYQMVKALISNGFNASIIHEKSDYHGVTDWLGEEYSEIPHSSIESQNLSVSPEDFIIIPELYGHVLEQLSNLSCSKIVLLQSYDYMFETIQPGVSWYEFGVTKCLTTTEEQKDYASQYMKNTTIDVLPVLIPDLFSNKEKPSKPIISIHTREQRDTMKIIKAFYLKYPQYRWVTFRDMRGLTQEEFSSHLKESFVSVWVDDISGFGTFPIESMSCGTPVIGKVPNIKPSWMNEDNGIWINDINIMPEVISEFIQNWLEDNINNSLYNKCLETSKEYRDYDTFENNVTELFTSYIEKRKELFEIQLEKIKVLEEE